MISELLRKSEVRKLFIAWKKLIEDTHAGLANKDPRAVELARKHNWTLEGLEALEALFNEAESGFEAEEKGTFIPSNEALSVVQSILDRAYNATGMVTESGGQGLATGVPAITARSLKPHAKPPPGQMLFSSIFDDPNPLYITEGAIAVAWRRLHGRHPFSESPPTVSLGDRARIVLVGDWGTGIERADGIATLMRSALEETPDRERHIVHLGDIYFSGWPEEARERFLNHWPVRPGETFASSWCINGNHDMYSGGHGYFATVLADPRFAQQRGCSYFLLENSKWQIIALDTAYDEWTFHGNQIAWAEAQRRRHGGKCILLSHHQPFSDWESQDKASKLASEARSLLRTPVVNGWIWGHEHRCAAYKPLDFQFTDASTGRLPFGCCSGHGGVPANQTKEPGPHTLYTLTEFMRSGIEKFGLFGFAILDIDGPNATITLVDEKNRRQFTHPIP